MILEGAGVCPLVEIGDIVKGRKVVDIVFDRNTAATCKAFNSLAMPRLEHPQKKWYFFHPARASQVNCDKCPILAKDPNHARKTKTPVELIREAEERGEAVREGRARRGATTVQELEEEDVKSTEHEDRNRFELIDITQEKEQ